MDTNCRAEVPPVSNSFYFSHFRNVCSAACANFNSMRRRNRVPGTL